MNFGYITVVQGSNSSKFPMCTSLLIDDHDTVAVIDPGAGPEALFSAMGNRKADIVVNTHYHFDHISGNCLFPRAQVYMNPAEVDVFSDLGRVGDWLGIREVYGDQGVADWIRAISEPDTAHTPYSPAHRHEWWLSTRSRARSYVYDRVWEIGKTRMIMVHAPGHTEGFCCPYFPDEGVVYTGDIDLTGFGPWYCGSDGNIEQFLLSAQRVARLDADWFVTGHQAGVVSRSDFLRRLEQFLEVIHDRQKRLTAWLEAGILPEDVPNHGLFYPPSYQADPWIAMWERIGVRKHIELLRQVVPGVVKQM